MIDLIIANIIPLLSLIVAILYGFVTYKEWKRGMASVRFLYFKKKNNPYLYNAALAFNGAAIFVLFCVSLYLFEI